MKKALTLLIKTITFKQKNQDGHHEPIIIAAVNISSV